MLIYVISSDHSPLHMSVNGLSDCIPVGKDHELDERLLPALRDADGIVWRFVGGDAGGTDPGGTAASDNFDAEAIITGTVDEVAERLSDLTPLQLLAVVDAESDREAPRKGVRTAINKAIEAANREPPNETTD